MPAAIPVGFEPEVPEGFEPDPIIPEGFEPDTPDAFQPDSESGFRPVMGDRSLKESTTQPTSEQVASALGIPGAERLTQDRLAGTADLPGGRQMSPEELETPLLRAPEESKRILGEVLARGALGPLSAAIIPEKQKTGFGAGIVEMAEGLTSPTGIASLPAFALAPQLMIPEMVAHSAQAAGQQFAEGDVGKGVATLGLGVAPLAHVLRGTLKPIEPVRPPPLPEPNLLPASQRILAETPTAKVEPVQSKEPVAVPVEIPAEGVLPEVRTQATPPPLPKWTQATEPTLSIVERIKESPEPQVIGITPPGSGVIQRALDFVKDIKDAATELPKMNDFRRSTLDWSAKLQRSFGEIREAQKAIQSVAKKPIEREAITNWIEAAGDDAVLASREAASSNPKLKSGYTAARSLTPEQLKTAQEVRVAFDELFKRGEKYDILSSFRDNYTPHIWDVGSRRLTGSSKALSDNFRFAKARTFESFFEGEALGFKPKTKDISKLLPVYLHEMNNAIAAKQYVESLSSGVASDGRPLIAARGIAKVIEGDEGKATLVMPKIPKDASLSDYRILDQPALADWRWVSKDDAGNPVFLKSDLALHPEAHARLKDILGRSAIREWYGTPTTKLAEIPKLLVKGLDAAQSEAKRTMLGFLSSFHQVQEGTHAIGHRVNPFSDIPKIDLSRNAAQMDAARHGLMLNPDRISERVFMEGVGQTGLMSKIPVVGKVADAYASYLFHDYIPGLKFKTYEDILRRNEHLYQNEIKSGVATLEEVKALSAEQSNAAYGHLNYADIARNPTMQHLLQLGLLAPDFLEARGRFSAQGAKALLGSKSGVEQLAALSFLAALQFGATRIINKLVDDDWHWDHPFEVIAGNRRYVMRSVPEDAFNLVKDTRQFIYGRLNPIIGRGAVQGVTGLNYRGEKVDFTETLGELLSTYIPITLRWMPGLRDLTQTSRNKPVSPLEEFAGSMGLRISRYSPVTETYKLASEWQEKQGVAKDRGTYPISKYQQLRYALEDGEFEKAEAEIETLVKSGMTRARVASGFRDSISHPFTGSVVSDARFKASLDAKGKLIYQAALDKRRDILVKAASIGLR